MGAAWNADLTVTSVTPEVDSTPGEFTATIADPNQIIMVAPWQAQALSVTVTMALGATMPAQVGSTLLARLRIT